MFVSAKVRVNDVENRLWSPYLRLIDFHAHDRMRSESHTF